MTRDDYLNCEPVSDFATWLSLRLSDENLNHNYYNRRNLRHTYHFNGLAQALGRYVWNGQDYETNSRCLAELESKLNNALNANDDDALCFAAVEVVKWGGVVNGNQRWLETSQSELRQIFTDTCCLLAHGSDCLGRIGRFTSGMSKIYSLLVQNFVIYDSRVAGAIAWLVVHWCQENDLSIVPSALQFVCMPANEGRGARRPKLRNPSGGRFQFPNYNNNPTTYAQWNLRASWVLKSTLGKSEKTPFHKENSPLRALEAALFMWGYDLSETCYWR